MLSVLALALQPLAVTAATGAASTECTVRAPPQLRKASPLSFGMNVVLGTIINLTYSDPALVKSVKTLNVGALRHPGGTVANYWTMANGSYVLRRGVREGSRLGGGRDRARPQCLRDEHGAIYRGAGVAG